MIIWILAIASYHKLPDTIPIHYNSAGQVNGFGGKATILVLPLIATILFIGLTMLNKYPHIFNFPVIITKENAQRQYMNATRLIRYLKFIIVVIFGFITFSIIQHANEQTYEPGYWFLLLIVGLFFIPLTYFIVKSFKMK